MCLDIWPWAGLTLPLYDRKEMSVLLRDDPETVLVQGESSIPVSLATSKTETCIRRSALIDAATHKSQATLWGYCFSCCYCLFVCFYHHLETKAQTG